MTEFWKRFCQIQRYAFFRGDDCVNKVPFSTGNHIEVGAAEALVDEMDQEISALRQQLAESKERVAEIVVAGERLCYELGSWMATEHDKDSQRAIAAWQSLRQQAERTGGKQ